MAKYKVLGAEGEQLVINGNTYGGGVGTVVELSEAEAAEALSAGHIELFDETVEESAEETVEGEKEEGEDGDSDEE